MRTIKISASAGLTMPHPTTQCASIRVDVGAEAELDHHEDGNAALRDLHEWLMSVAQARLDKVVADALAVTPKNPPAAVTQAVGSRETSWLKRGAWVAASDGRVGLIPEDGMEQRRGDADMVQVQLGADGPVQWMRIDSLLEATEAEIAGATGERPKTELAKPEPAKTEPAKPEPAKFTFNGKQYARTHRGPMAAFNAAKELIAQCNDVAELPRQQIENLAGVLGECGRADLADKLSDALEDRAEALEGAVSPAADPDDVPFALEPETTPASKPEPPPAQPNGEEDLRALATRVMDQVGRPKVQAIIVAAGAERLRDLDAAGQARVRAALMEAVA